MYLPGTALPSPPNTPYFLPHYANSQRTIFRALWESPEEEGNWGYGAGFARPIPPYLSIHHGNSQRAIFRTFVQTIPYGKISGVETTQAKIPPPPGLIASLTAGFDVVSKNILLISLPVLLDVFLWIGPHLSLKKYFQPAMEYFMANASAVALEDMPDPAFVEQVWIDFFGRFNLFSLLRTIPVGVTSLMSGKLPQTNPLGNPLLIEVDSFLTIAGWIAIIILAGWLIGGVYFHWVSSVTLKVEDRRPFLQALGHTVLLSVMWIILLVLIGFPLLLMISFITLISPFLAQAALLILALFSAWIILPFFFSPHGIFAYRQNALTAILNSLRMARFTLPTSSMFILMLFIISLGLDYLWRTPPEESWLALIGIAGHAFISTALLSASFVYYRDANTWLQVVFEHMKSQPKSARA